VASSVAGGQDPVLRHLGVTGRLVSGYSLPPPTPPTFSNIMDQTVRARQVMECDCPSSCVVRPVNSCRICSDACNVFPDTTKADTIRYIGSDTIPIR